eukprot:15294177-Heterocapsa_arctica.AAC.1
MHQGALDAARGCDCGQEDTVVRQSNSMPLVGGLLHLPEVISTSGNIPLPLLGWLGEAGLEDLPDVARCTGDDSFN